MSPFLFAPRRLTVPRADGEEEEAGSLFLSHLLLEYLSGARGRVARSQRLGQISSLLAGRRGSDKVDDAVNDSWPRQEP